MKKVLYPHQKKQNKEVSHELKTLDHILYGAATGFGKSIAMQSLIKKYLKKDYRVLVLAPYRKLVFQLEQTFSMHEPRIIMGTLDRGDRLSSLVISTLDTTNNRLKKQSNAYEGFDIILIDEVHLTGNFPPKNRSRMELLYNKYWHSAKWIGFTATPITDKGYRLEGWDKCVYKYQTRDLIKMGFLADYDYYAPTNLDLSSLRVDYKGEFKNEDVEKVTTEASAIASVKKHYKENGKSKKSLIFASSIRHGELLQKAIKNSSVIHSGLKESEQIEILKDFQYKKEGCLINVAMLVAGFDDPTIDLLILARPIKSIRTAIQCWGRSLRKHNDKRAKILDMCNVYETCGLPKDLRDFNRVKKPKNEMTDKDMLDEVLTVIKCPFCKTISERSSCKIKKKETKTSITTKLFCPSCGKEIESKRKELSEVDDLQKIEESLEVKQLIPAERKKLISELITEFTKAKPSWSYFIMRAISATGRNELLDQVLAKTVKNKTKWKNIMTLFEDAKNEKN